MVLRYPLSTSLYWTLALGLIAAAPTATHAQDVRTAITLASSRVSIAGTSNVHDYSAASTAVRLVHVELAAPCATWGDVLKAGALKSFELAVPAASLQSKEEGLDKNMHKALKAAQHPDITLRVTALEPAAGVAGAYRAAAALTVAGVEKPVALEFTTELQGGALVVKGSLPVLMPDHGIAPPKAMLGMLKTHPKVVVSFTATLTLPVE